MTVLDDIEIDIVPGDDVDTPTRRRVGRATVPGQRATRSKAAQRAIDRRQRRISRGVGESSKSVASHLPSRSLRSRVSAVPFVVPVLALLIAGLALSLLLSTKAAQDSYRLGVERVQNQTLMDQRDSLKRSFESADSAPELSDKATKLGMVPSSNPARMIVRADGRTRVLGDPEPAQGKPMLTINPSDQPDPLSKIDKSKVDDSRGLPDAQQDSGSSAAGGGSPAAAPAPAPAMPTPAPAPLPLNPNVLPTNVTGAAPTTPGHAN